MNQLELRDLLYENNVPESWYSLDEGLKADAYILYKNYSVWEYFYLDERGERRDHKIFQNAEEAYEYFWERIKTNLRVFKIKPRNKQDNE